MANVRHSGLVGIVVALRHDAAPSRFGVFEIGSWRAFSVGSSAGGFVCFVAG